MSDSSTLHDPEYRNGFRLFARLKFGIRAGNTVSEATPKTAYITDSVDMSMASVSYDIGEGSKVLDAVIRPDTVTRHFGDLPSDRLIEKGTLKTADNVLIPAPQYTDQPVVHPEEWRQRTPHLVTTAFKVFVFVNSGARPVSVAQSFVLKRDWVRAMREQCEWFEQQQQQQQGTRALEEACDPRDLELLPQSAAGLELTPGDCDEVRNYMNHTFSLDFNFANTSVLMHVMPPRNRAEHAAYLDSIRSIEAYEQKFATRSMLEDSKKFNDMIQQQSAELSRMIKENTVVKNMAATQFMAACTQLPFQGQMMRMTDMAKYFMSLHDEKLPDSVLLLNVMAACNAHMQRLADLEKLSDFEAARFLSKVLTVNTFNNKAVPYTSDLSIRSIMINPLNTAQLAYAVELSEDIRGALRQPGHTDGVIKKDDCEGHMVLIMAIFKATAQVAAAAAQCGGIAGYVKKYGREPMFGSSTTEERTMAASFLHRCSVMIQSGVIQFMNPLGGAVAASASSMASHTQAMFAGPVGVRHRGVCGEKTRLRGDEDGAQPVPKKQPAAAEESVGGHSWACLAFQPPKGSAERARTYFLMEGTAAVNQLNTDGTQAIEKTVLAKPLASKLLQQNGFTVRGRANGHDVLQKTVSVSEAIHMSQMNVLMAPINEAESRAEIDFQFFDQRRPSNKPLFYRDVYFMGNNIVLREDRSSEAVEFGFPFQEFNIADSDMVLEKNSSLPYTDPDEVAKLNYWMFRRSKEIMMPLLKHDRFVQGCNRAWGEFRLVEHPREVLESQQKEEHVAISIAMHPEPILVKSEYVCTNVSDAFSDKALLHRNYEEQKSFCEKQNAAFEAEGIGHRMKCWIWQHCLVRTLYLYLPDLCKTTVAMLPGEENAPGHERRKGAAPTHCAPDAQPQQTHHASKHGKKRHGRKH